VAIVAGAAIRLAKAHLNRVWMGLAAALGAGLMFFQILGPVPLILLGALIGLVCHALNQRERAA
jgi:chromate transport protein ChrA